MRKIFLILTLIFVSVFNFAQSEQTTVFDGENDPQYVTGKLYDDDFNLRIEGFSFESESKKTEENKFIVIFTFGKNYNTVYLKEREGKTNNSFSPFYLKMIRTNNTAKKDSKAEFNIDSIRKMNIKPLTVTIFDVFQNKIIYQEEFKLVEEIYFGAQKEEELRKKGLKPSPNIFNGKETLKCSGTKKAKTRTGQNYIFNLFFYM